MKPCVNNKNLQCEKCKQIKTELLKRYDSVFESIAEFENEVRKQCGDNCEFLNRKEKDIDG